MPMERQAKSFKRNAPMCADIVKIGGSFALPASNTDQYHTLRRSGEDWVIGGTVDAITLELSDANLWIPRSSSVVRSRLVSTSVGHRTKVYDSELVNCVVGVDQKSERKHTTIIDSRLGGVVVVGDLLNGVDHQPAVAHAA